MSKALEPCASHDIVRSLYATSALRDLTTPIGLRPIDPLIRNLTEYRDVIRRITEGDSP